jgi:hypothetical protein
MADTSIQGSDIAFYVRNDSGGTTWKRLVCEDTLAFDLTSEIQAQKTKCGTFKGVDVPEFKVNGTGVNNKTPTSSEVSHDGITSLMLAKTLQQFRIQDIATLGSVILLAGTGYFSSLQMTFNNAEVCKFTYAFEGTGTLEEHES